MVRCESRPSTIGHITLDTKQTGAPSAGNPHAGCDVAGAGDGFTVWLLRHSQRKRGETARQDLRNTAPVLDPTAEWTVKTAMVLDSTRPKAAGVRFYRRDDCAAMRESSTIPQHTRVWIGRSDERHILALGTDYQYLQADTREVHGKSTITTIVVGHFVVQSITQRKMPKFSHLNMPVLQPKPANWDVYLIPIWPIESVAIWPPERSFTNGGPEGIAYLMDRWRTGERVDKITFEEHDS